MSQELLAQIRKQQQLSNDVIGIIKPFVHQFFFSETSLEDIQSSDISSFARGTNNDLKPDIDIMFLDVPCDTARGHTDWTPIGTREATGRKEGIISLDELGQYDAMTAEMVSQIQSALDGYFELEPGSTQFNYFRSWATYPGYFFNLAVPHTEFGEIELDVNIFYMSDHFGVDHGQRFDDYIKRLEKKNGLQAIVPLIEDIRLLKSQGKKIGIDADGWVDRTQKLAGFVVEALFMQRFPPYTYTELMDQIAAHNWEPGKEPKEQWIGGQNNQIIGMDFSFSDLLHNMAFENQALPLGTWQNLQRIAKDHLSNIG